MSTKLALLLLCAGISFGQKKPITLDTLREFGGEHDAPGPARWAPDGKTFAFEQGKTLKLYLPEKKGPKTIVSLDVLETAAVKPAADGPMEWTNRRAHTGGVAWCPDGKSLLDTVNGDIFLIYAGNGKWEQITKTDVEIGRASCRERGEVLVG